MIGLLRQGTVEGWKRDLLEKAGVDFDLERVSAALDENKNAT